MHSNNVDQKYERDLEDPQALGFSKFAVLGISIGTQRNISANLSVGNTPNALETP